MISENTIRRITNETIRQYIAENFKSNVIAYHGTPYDFIRFQTNNIGNGEGNQSFGYGLYFTDNKGVAEFYAKTIGKGHGNIYTVTIKDGQFFEWYGKLDEDFKQAFIEKMKENGYDTMPYKRMLTKNGIETKTDTVENVINFFPNGKFLYENLSLMLNGDKNASNFLSRLGFNGITYPVGQFFKKGGNLYGYNYVVFNENDIQIIDKKSI